MNFFKETYEKLTDNIFGEKPFIQHPGKYCEMDIDSGKVVQTLMDESNVESKLAPQVQDLVKLIFDIGMMKQTMTEFHLDTRKMPLDRLNTKQIQDAMSVLKKISDIIQSDGSSLQFIEASNQFYAMILHDFGVKPLPIIDSAAAVADNFEMLESLLEIEVAFRLLNEKSDGVRNSIDQKYERLETYLNPLDKASIEFKLLSEYVSNTHYAEDNAYKVEVDEIFQAYRKLEVYRYSAFWNLRNRKLLWHGSRLSNFVGILSHGLKIVPPESPDTSSKFGKGIYFTDMASKCSKSCVPTNSNNVGLMLLCQVALGNALDLETDEMVQKLPDHRHSVKRIGRISPNPDRNHRRYNGVIIPVGPPIKDRTVISDRLYNEYVVFNEAQVKIEYIFKVKFSYNYERRRSSI